MRRPCEALSADGRGSRHGSDDTRAGCIVKERGRRKGRERRMEGRGKEGRGALRGRGGEGRGGEGGERRMEGSGGGKEVERRRNEGRRGGKEGSEGR